MSFVPALPDGYVCPEGTVPGWLNADGLPTACVGDLPLVEPLPERTPGEDIGELIPPIEVWPAPPVLVEPSVPAVPPSAPSLPDTGADLLSAVVVGVVLLAIGAWMLWARRAVGS